MPSSSEKAGLAFSVSRMKNYLKTKKEIGRIGECAPVYLTATLEYLSAECLELAGNTTKDNMKKRVTPEFIKFAIKNDEELNCLFGPHLEDELGDHAWESYFNLKKVHAQVHSEQSKSKDAYPYLSYLLGQALEKIVLTAIKLRNGATLSSREIQSAVRFVLPGELAKHAISEGVKAVTKYTSV